MNFLEGIEESMVLSLVYLGELVHHLVILFLMFALVVCLVAEKLDGRERWRKGGRPSLGLESSRAAFLASSSALSLPTKSIWPATHVKEMVEVLRGAPLRRGPGGGG